LDVNGAEKRACFVIRTRVFGKTLRTPAPDPKCKIHNGSSSGKGQSKSQYVSQVRCLGKFVITLSLASLRFFEGGQCVLSACVNLRTVVVTELVHVRPLHTNTRKVKTTEVLWPLVSGLLPA
jgi:hypothetical protein